MCSCYNGLAFELRSIFKAENMICVTSKPLILQPGNYSYQYRISGYSAQKIQGVIVHKEKKIHVIFFSNII